MHILCLDSILANDVDIVSSTSTMVAEEYDNPLQANPSGLKVLQLIL
jgi:hypothetical protein